MQYNIFVNLFVQYLINSILFYLIHQIKNFYPISIPFTQLTLKRLPSTFYQNSLTRSHQKQSQYLRRKKKKDTPTPDCPSANKLHFRSPFSLSIIFRTRLAKLSIYIPSVHPHETRERRTNTRWLPDRHHLRLVPFDHGRYSQVPHPLSSSSPILSCSPSPPPLLPLRPSLLNGERNRMKKNRLMNRR